MEKVDNKEPDSLRFVGDYGEHKLDLQYRIAIPSKFELQKQNIYLLKTAETSKDGSKRIVIKCFTSGFLKNLGDGFLPEYGDQIVLCTVDKNRKLTLGTKMDIDFSENKPVHIVGRGHFFEIIFDYEKRDIDSNEVNQLLSKIAFDTKKKVRAAT